MPLECRKDGKRGKTTKEQERVQPEKGKIKDRMRQELERVRKDDQG